MTTLPPTGCLPAAITLFGGGSNQCVTRLNQDAVAFNKKLNNTSESLLDKMPGLKLLVFDIYQPLLDMVMKPADNGKAPIKISTNYLNFFEYELCRKTWIFKMHFYEVSFFNQRKSLYYEVTFLI